MQVSAKFLPLVLACGFAANTQAANFLTFVDDHAGFLATIGATTVVTEDFASAVDGEPLPAQSDPQDVWRGFTTGVFGPGVFVDWGGGGPAPRYCADLASATCIPWNTSVPNVPGIFGNFNGPDNGISFKPSSPTIAGISFEFVDWNDGGMRSHLLILASDGTTTTVSGPINPNNAPSQIFGVTLSPADIAAGLYIEEMRWVGVPGGREAVGFFNFSTYTNPTLTQAAAKPVPTLSTWGGLLLGLGIVGCAVRLRKRHMPATHSR